MRAVPPSRGEADCVRRPLVHSSAVGFARCSLRYSPQWESLAGDLVRRRLSAGEDLFQQGEPAESMWLIKAGSVKLWKTTEDGRILTLDIRKAGDLLGENVLMEDGGTYPVAATCLGPTVTCGIDRRTFESLVTRYPAVGLVVIRNLSRRIDHLSGKLGALSEPNLDDRLYEVLANVARDVGTPAPGGVDHRFPSDARGDRFPRRRSPGERYPRPRQASRHGARSHGREISLRSGYCLSGLPPAQDASSGCFPPRTP